MKFKKGYTLIEVLIGVIAISAMSAAIVPLVLNNNQIANAQSLANETILYSKIYAKYLLNNDKVIRDAVQSNGIAFVRWTSLKNTGYAPSGTIADTNTLGQTPCVAVMSNSQTNQLTPFMFFVGGNGRERNFTSLDASNTINQIGGMAGVYLNDPSNKDVWQSGTGAFGNKSGWFLPSTTPYLQQIQSGCGAQPSNNSIVMNLNMMSEYGGVLTPDVSLHRFKDPANPNLGDTENTNTSQTDISLAPVDPLNQNQPSKKLYFNGNEPATGTYMYSQGGRTVQVTNATLAANTLQPTQEIPVLTYCRDDQLGTIAKEDSSSNTILKGILICTNNPLQCQGVDPTGQPLSSYCYLPVSGASLTYKPNTSQANCPDGYYLDATVPPIVIEGNPPPNFDGSKWECWASAFGVCTNWQYVVRPMCSWTSPQTSYTQTGIKSYRGFSIGTGLTTTTIWQPNSNGYDCNYNGKDNSAPGIIRTYTCNSTPPVLDFNN